LEHATERTVGDRNLVDHATPHGLEAPSLRRCKVVRQPEGPDFGELPLPLDHAALEVLGSRRHLGHGLVALLEHTERIP
jgi:hypothetical protein